MTHLTRRLFLQGLAGLTVTSTAFGAYAVVIEPGLRLDVTSYKVTPPRWPDGLELKAVVLADLHACEPWMSPSRIRSIAEVANALNPDVIFLLGDFNGGHRYVTGPVLPEQWAEALSILKAPLGVYSVLGNHDWWHGTLPGTKGDEAESIRRALKHANFTLLENDAVALRKGDQAFWVLGLGDQMAYRAGRHNFHGIDDLPATLAKVTDDAPIVLLAHEPFLFHHVPSRVALTLCGHTHGGQVNLPFISPIYERAHFGTDKVYGHIVEDDRHMIISGGLGTSIAPIRIMRPPEVVAVTLTSGGTSVNPVV
jgi:predicted MPP superfamily phosphohydrolase